LSAAKVREKDLEDLIRQSLGIELYRRGLISLGKAAEIAGVSTKWEMMHLLAKHGDYIDYAAEDAKKDMETLFEILNT
jgi:predicted HTH domain antitoxin